MMDIRRLYAGEIDEIPGGSQLSKGRAMINLVDTRLNETTAAALCFQESPPDRYLVICTKNGVVKGMLRGMHECSTPGHSDR